MGGSESFNEKLCLQAAHSDGASQEGPRVNGIENWAYSRSPVWLQNLAIGLYGLRYRHERLGGDFERYVGEFRQRESWSREKFDRYIAERLGAVLSRAAREVPYYRRTWSAASLDPTHLARMGPADLSRLPILRKSEVRDCPKAFVSQSAGPLRWPHRYYTSGSTGTPLTVFCTSDDHRRFIAAREARSFGWAGTSVRMPRSMIGGRMVLSSHNAPPPYYRWNRAERQVYFSGYHISAAHTPNYVEGFNRYRPQLLTGYANAHYHLARLMLAEGLKLDYIPRALVLSSEKLTAEMKATLSLAFGARAYEEFGAVENCVLATECEQGRLHVSPDFGIVEIVDDVGKPLPPGRAGKMICTGLVNRTQPLIRYDIGDVAAWATEPCPCGRHHLPVLEQVVGRLEDLVIGRNGQVSVRFHGLFISLPNVLEGQVIQEDLDHIRVRVVVREAFSLREIEAIRRRVAEERLGPMHVEVERVPHLERTEQGKFRAVINRLPRETIEKALGNMSRAPRLMDSDPHANPNAL
jgi:phenylacetate-CoA ligase